jgi:hypothetical protein
MRFFENTSSYAYYLGLAYCRLVETQITYKGHRLDGSTEDEEEAVGHAI